MALVLVNKDGTSNAKPGDTVIHGGGMTTINKDGTKTTVPLPGVGKTKNYNTVVDVMNNLTKTESAWATGGSSSSSGRTQSVTQNPVEVFDSETNYDDFTSSLSFNYDPMAAVNGNIPNYSGSGSSVSLSNVVGYGIVGLVLIAVLDKLIG
ncbi:MAG: hypothetical protein E7222_04220 [Clostridiales bacterium]|nr:hypothetical protein [Clostridiales bacterium]